MPEQYYAGYEPEEEQQLPPPELGGQEGYDVTPPSLPSAPPSQPDTLQGDGQELPVISSPPAPSPIVGTIEPIDVPADLKPDQPGGQVATYEGKEVYIKGSTMRDSGFHTKEEYMQAQSAGVGLGPHEGRLVPENSAIINTNWTVFDVKSGFNKNIPIQVRYSGEEPSSAPVSDDVWRKVVEGDYLVPITAISEKDETKTLLFKPEFAQQFNQLKGEARLEKAKELGIVPPDTNLIRGANNIDAWEYIPASEFMKLEQSDKTLRRIKQYRTLDGKYDVISMIKDEAISPPEFDAVFGKGAYRDFKNTADAHVGMVFDFDTNKFVWATEPEVKAREEYYQGNPLVAPPGTPGKMAPKEYDRARAEAEKWLKQFEVETAFTESGQTEYNWIAAVRDKDADKQLNILFLGNKTQINELKDTASALAKLDKYVTPDGYDIAKYLRNNEKDTKTLGTAQFTAEAIKEAQAYNQKYYGTGAPEYMPFKEYAADYFKQKGWQTNIKPVSMTPDEWKLYDSRLNEAQKAYEAKYTATMNLKDYTERYFEVKGWEYDVDPTKMKQQERRSYDMKIAEATDAYHTKYGARQIAESIAGTVLGAGIPAARAFSPEVKLKDISGAEWAITGAQGVLIASGAGAFPSGVIRTGVEIAAGGIFGYSLATDWERMSWPERAFNAGITALIFAPALKSIAGKVKEYAVGAKAIDAETFLKSEANLSANAKNVEKYYGTVAVNKLNEVYTAQTDLIKSVEAQDIAATKALVKLDKAKAELKTIEQRLAEHKKIPFSQAQYDSLLVDAKNTRLNIVKQSNKYDAAIANAERQIKPYEEALANKWEGFKQSVKGSPNFDSPMTQELYSSRNIVDYTRNLADSLVKGNPKGLNITQLRNDLARVTKEYEGLRSKYPTDAYTWSGKLMEQLDLEAKILQYQAGDISSIGKALQKARKDLAYERKWLSRTAPGSESYPGAVNARNIAEAKVRALEEKYSKALKGLKVEASTKGELSRGTTRTLVKPPSTRPSTLRTAEGKLVEKAGKFTGGGVRARPATVAGALVYAISRKAVADAQEGAPLEFDTERISKVITEAGGNPAITEMPDIKRLIQEEYEKAYRIAKSDELARDDAIRPYLDVKAINKALDEAQARLEAIQPSEYPAPAPAPAPAPQPQPRPQPQPPKPEIPPLPKPKPPKPPETPKSPIPIRPSPTSSEKEKHDFVDIVEGVIARRRGELNGQSLWLVDYYPYGPKDRLVMLGAAPKGVTPASGKGSLKRSATLIRGIPPSKPLYRDTGAVDDIIEKSVSGKGIVVRSVRDKSVTFRKQRTLEPQIRKLINIGGGIEVDKQGRGHIKL